MHKVIDLSLKDTVNWLKARPKDAHKGMFGRVLVIGGDYGMPGAVRLVAEGALRVGAGVVSVATRKEHITAVVSTRPELLCYGIDSNFDTLEELAKNADVIALGSGLGQSKWSIDIFNKIININKPLVIDADALNLLAISKQNFTNTNNWILTPHPGEASRLLGITTKKIQENRVLSIINLVNKYKCTVVLKGSNSLIATTDNKIFRCNKGNPGMSSAGMGDVLGGIIAGLLGQKISHEKAAIFAVLLHARAGDRAMQKRGGNVVLASDLLQELIVNISQEDSLIM